MSARVTAEVWSRYPQGAGEMLLALALADQSTDAGEYIAISIAGLARKTRQADRTVREQLQGMVAAGWLVQMENSKAFRICPEWLGGADLVPPVAANDGKKITKTGTRLSKDWQLPEEWKAWALATFPAWTPAFVASVAERFRDHWTSASGQAASKVEWDGTWRNWCRKEPAVPPAAAPTAAGGEWWKSSAAIERKAAELEIARINGELWNQWRDRIFRAAGDGPWSKMLPQAHAEEGFKSVANLAAKMKQLKEATSAA